MSYILDAVRKADQERRENLTPAVHSLGAHSQSKMPESSRFGAHWPVIAAGVVLLNLTGWYWSSNARNATELQALKHTPIAAEAKLPDSKDVITESQTEHLAASSQALTKIPLWQASADAQNIVRSLEFSFHVYAEDAAQRTIIINGQRVAEKQRISQDLSLSEITSTGVTLLYQNNSLIEVDILEQW